MVRANLIKLRRRFLIATASVVCSGLAIVAPVALAQDMSPSDWLRKMASAVQTTNYEGTVIRIQNGTAEALKVVHIVSDGVVREKVIVQDGNGLEIIRNGNEVHCILPDKKSVLVGEWNDQSTLFSTLPSSDIRFGAEYDVSIVRKDRVAGRKAVMLAIRPHDSFRYGHRIWLDIKTGFPLQTKLIDANGEPIVQVKFADISIGQDISLAALAPSYDTDDFRWYDQPERDVIRAVETDWSCSNLPPGFRVISTQESTFPGAAELVTHILYSDGLASVSIFITPDTGKKIAERSRVGASSSFSIVIEDHVVTAVGGVPGTTGAQFARTIQYS